MPWGLRLNANLAPASTDFCNPPPFRYLLYQNNGAVILAPPGPGESWPLRVGESGFLFPVPPGITFPNGSPGLVGSFGLGKLGGVNLPSSISNAYLAHLEVLVICNLLALRTASFEVDNCGILLSF